MILEDKLRKFLNISFFRSKSIITYIEAKELLKENPQGILLDVRSRQEYKEGHLTNAICIPAYELQEEIDNIIEDKNNLIIIYCQTGARSRKASSILRKMGYTNLYEIDGGLDNI